MCVCARVAKDGIAKCMRPCHSPRGEENELCSRTLASPPTRTQTHTLGTRRGVLRRGIVSRYQRLCDCAGAHTMPSLI
jgi:hypothetical protein